MSNFSKKIASVFGIMVGVAIIVIGFHLQKTKSYVIGSQIAFGADFYTEIYDVTKETGNSICDAINELTYTVSWLIISLGAMDVCFFVYKFVKACCERNNPVYNASESPYISKAKPSSQKATQCECGEMFYGVFCPICGKRAPNDQLVDPRKAEAESSSHTCKCGMRFYGGTCPNCGRNAEDL